MEKVFAIVDCNSFYASCERVFRPDLEGKPIVVLSNNDGCIVAATKEAKQLPIPRGAPYFQCKQLLKENNVHVFSSNYPLYGDLSDRVMEVLHQFSPDVELYSIDESFIDLTEFKHLDLIAYCQKIKETIKQWTGIPVSIGIGATRTLAKVANNIAKKEEKYNNVFHIENNKVDGILEQLPVSEIWGIGRRMTKRFALDFRANIKTTLDLVNKPDSWIRQQGGVMLLKTVHELRGISCIEIEKLDDQRKGILTSRSFGRAVTSYHELEEAITAYTSTCAMKLRRQKSAAGTISVFASTGTQHRDTYFAPQKTMILPETTENTGILVRYAIKGLKKIHQPGFTYKRAGVFISGIMPVTNQQTTIFSAENKTHSKNLMEAFDVINRKMGNETIRYASEGKEKEWKLKSQWRSPEYTTQWNDLMEVD